MSTYAEFLARKAQLTNARGTSRPPMPGSGL